MSYSFLLYEDFFHYICIYHLNLTITPKKLFFFCFNLHMGKWNFRKWNDFFTIIYFTVMPDSLLGRKRQSLPEKNLQSWVGGRTNKKKITVQWMELYVMHVQGAVNTCGMCISISCAEVCGTSATWMVPSTRLVLP